MNALVLLADKGTTNPQAGTLNLLNAGWVQAKLIANPMVEGGLITPPHAVAVFFEVDHTFCNRPIELVLSLKTQDGQPVVLNGPLGPQEVRLTNHVTVPSPAMAPIAAPGTGNLLLELVPGLPLQPGEYRWEVTIAGQQGESWYVSFRLLPSDQAPTMIFGAPVQPPE